ncbi:MAG: AMP-binding protein [Opitutales bacterium]
MERTQLVSLVNATGVAEWHGGGAFLRDPHWTPAQRVGFERLVATPAVVAPPADGLGWLGIATGGSSGGLTFARHDELTLGAAARGFAGHFAMPVINAVDVLPPWHVSGLMARVRCAVTGGRHLPWAWKELEVGNFPALGRSDAWVLSLVPTQLQRLLPSSSAVGWLRAFRVILIGGGPVWPALADAAVAAQLPVALSYGLTETAAMVTAQLPAEASRGDRSSGRALPHARIEICDVTTGALLPAGATGLVRITGESVMRGYYPARAADRAFVTADLGWLEADGRVSLAGRRDDVIITGGVKVNPREVEAVLQAAGGLVEVAVIGVPHPEWGEEVVACYVGAMELAPDSPATGQLPRAQRPKRYVRFAAADWPRNAQGKVNRAVLRTAASAGVDPGR